MSTRKSLKRETIRHCSVLYASHFILDLAIFKHKLDSFLQPQFDMIMPYICGIIAPHANLARILRYHLGVQEKYKILALQRLIFGPRAFAYELKDSRDQEYLCFSTPTSTPLLPPEVVSAHLNFSACWPCPTYIIGLRAKI